MNKVLFALIRIFGFEALWLRFFSGWKSSKIKSAIKCGLNPNAVSISGTPLLHFAILKHQTDALLAIIDEGGDPDLTDNNGCNSLYLAIESGDYSLLAMLLEKGAYLKREDKGGFTPLAWSVIIGVKSLEKNKYGLRAGIIKCVDLLLSKGANPSSYGSNNNSPIMLSVFNADIELFKKFVDAGADVSLQNQIGDSPRSMIEQKSLKEFSDYLLLQKDTIQP